MIMAIPSWQMYMFVLVNICRAKNVNALSVVACVSARWNGHYFLGRKWKKKKTRENRSVHRKLQKSIHFNLMQSANEFPAKIELFHFRVIHVAYTHLMTKRHKRINDQPNRSSSFYSMQSSYFTEHRLILHLPPGEERQQLPHPDIKINRITQYINALLWQCNALQFTRDHHHTIQSMKNLKLLSMTHWQYMDTYGLDWCCDVCGAQFAIDEKKNDGFLEMFIHLT